MGRRVVVGGAVQLHRVTVQTVGGGPERLSQVGLLVLEPTADEPDEQPEGVVIHRHGLRRVGGPVQLTGDLLDVARMGAQLGRLNLDRTAGKHRHRHAGRPSRGEPSPSGRNR